MTILFYIQTVAINSGLFLLLHCSQTLQESPTAWVTPYPPSHRGFLAKYELSSSMKAEAGRILSLWLNYLLQMAIFQGAVGSGYWHFRVTEVFFQIQSCLHSSSDQCVCERQSGTSLCACSRYSSEGVLWGSNLFHSLALLNTLAKNPVILSYLLKA